MARKQKEKDKEKEGAHIKQKAVGRKDAKGAPPAAALTPLELLAPVPMAALADPASKALVRQQFERNSSCFVRMGGKGDGSVAATHRLWQLLRGGGTCKVDAFEPWVDMMAAIVMHLLPDDFLPEGKWLAPAAGGKAKGRKGGQTKVSAEEFIAALRDPAQRTVTVTARDYTGNSKIVPEHFDNAVLTTIITVAPGAATGAQLHVFPTAAKEWVSCDDGPCPDAATVVVSAGRHLQHITGNPKHAPCLHKVTHEGAPEEFDKETSRQSVAVSITAFTQLDHPKVPSTGKALLIEDVGV
eukprot:TRINITY_DN11428_c0_g1_i1.p1 TRINITY_DN11428_c0_g1~~TRINITY_DN11428_c0_g1_i1.p1  ORF type:complete len:298 (+),score=98.66 TRINITY_DN11428_c0_g1_i1:115-1008(+)